MERLIEEWKNRPIHKDQLFITDGIIDPARWRNAKFKILFLLKEAYDSKPQGKKTWDLCKLIRETWKGPRYKMWWSMAQWAYGITQLHEQGEIPFFIKQNMEIKGKRKNCIILTMQLSLMVYL